MALHGHVTSALGTTSRGNDLVRFSRALVWAIFFGLLIGCGGGGAAAPATKPGKESQKERRKVAPAKRHRGTGKEKDDDKKSLIDSAKEKAKKAVKPDDGEKILGTDSIPAELVKLQSQLADLQVQIGDMKNFEKSAAASLGEVQESLEGMKEDVDKAKSQAEGVSELVKKNEGVLKKLERAQKEVSALAAKANESADINRDRAADIDTKFDEVAESMDSLGKDIAGLRQDGRDAVDSHKLYLGKDDFSGWRGKFDQWKDRGPEGGPYYYEEPQPKWWHLAVAGLVSLIIGGMVFYLALKAIRPAYTNLNEVRAKLGTLGARQQAEAGPPPEPPQEE